MLPTNDVRVMRFKISVALLLTVAAGSIDVVGFSAFWHVFTAHMTGNTAHFGLAVVQRHWGDAARAGIVIPVFLAGSVLGRCLIELGARKRWTRVASLVFLLQSAVVTEVLWMNASQSSNGSQWASLLSLTVAMGLQTAVLTRVGPLTVHTTFVTGMLNSLAQRLSLVIFWAVDAVRGREGRPLWHTRALRESGFLISVWVAYAAGACAGAFLAIHWKTNALFLPLAIFFVAIVIDQVQPLGLQEEQDEAKQERALREQTQPGML